MIRQCKDIPDQEFLDAVQRAPGVRHDGTGWRMRWKVQEELEKVLGPIPEKLFLAKAKKLIRAKKMHGCECGCRGDYTVEYEYQ